MPHAEHGFVGEKEKRPLCCPQVSGPQYPALGSPPRKVPVSGQVCPKALKTHVAEGAHGHAHGGMGVPGRRRVTFLGVQKPRYSSSPDPFWSFPFLGLHHALEIIVNTEVTSRKVSPGLLGTAVWGTLQQMTISLEKKIHDLAVEMFARHTVEVNE